MPARNEVLADHFIRCAGIAAVYVDAAGEIGAADGAVIVCPPGRVMFCCAQGSHAKVATLAAARMRAGSGQAGALAAVREAAADLGIGLTAHETVVRRAFAAVQVIDDQFTELQRNGGMKEMNREFKAARKAGDVLRYHDFLHSKKLTMLEAIARRL